MFGVAARQAQGKLVVAIRAKKSPGAARSRIREPICSSASSQPRCP
jgi:hypothetical protein